MGSMFINSNDWVSLIFRLTLALLVGCLIGLNRQQGGRPAGIRTFMLVSLGAAMFVMIPLQAEGDSPYAATNALSRTVQGVATGVGFIGAGMILQQSHRELGRLEVKGLTTAATIWVAAGLGAAIGCGLWQMSLIGAILTLVILSGVKKIQKSSLIRFRHSQRGKSGKSHAKESEDSQTKE
ncbi:MAG TPA: MgtC/SapB family protein [Coleofasciculaceae cyanobacterium]|jgi:putative Mg2+ transporter-C (MgtC) family protein